MEKSLNIGSRKIPYILRRSNRAKKVRITIYNNGRIVVTVPLSASLSYGEDFVSKKAQWIYKKIKFRKFNKPDSLVSSRERSDYLKNKKKARELVLKKIEYFNQFYKLKFKRISIRNQKTRWGSCSQKGNLNFNYRIVNLPPKLAYYLIVHELCHLKEFNHSEAFWNLVGKTIPQYKALRKELKLG